MKVLLVIATLYIAGTAGSLTGEQYPKLFDKDTINDCCASTKTSRADVFRAWQRGFKRSNEHQKAFAFCVLRRKDVVNSAGELQQPAFDTLLYIVGFSKGSFNRLHDACPGEVGGPGTSPNNRANNLMACIFYRS